uniref:Nebulin n=1 Tax=Phallusia mammillata TaxID=59560 RepID=A0A6F9DMR0_9ASCI|nr:nebulin [Phallusia mammillata]
MTETDRYKAMKESDKSASEVKYREDYEKEKENGKGMQVAETHEMVLAKELKPVQSKKMYEEGSKKLLPKVQVGSDIQEITRAVSSQKLASDRTYHSEYEKEMVGKAPQDLAKSYPEYDRLRDVSKLTSKALYQKDAEKIMHHHNLPLDYPEFVRAKESAKNASDIEYQKQRKETIDKYRGFQTMDSKDHPIVQHGIKAADLISDRLYKEDWEYEKNLIFYPVHVTPGYEQALEASKFQSMAAYKKDAEKSKMKNNFRVTDTEQYQAAQNLLNLVSENKYSAEYMENRGKALHSIAETPEMAISKSVAPLLSDKTYTDKAKSIMQKYNLDSSTQSIAHALGTQKSFSPHGYMVDFKKNIIGKAPSDLVNSYPEYAVARNVTKMASKSGYGKEADKIMHTHNLPLDYPEFVRAKQNAKNASDAEYQKQRAEVINQYRGFQTMDSKEHPIVQQGIKAAELVSNALYKEDWEYDKQMIYFPAHITPGYEANADVKKVQSDVSTTVANEST